MVIPCKFVRTISYKQMRLAPVSYRDGVLKLFTYFSSLGKIVLRKYGMFFLFSYFCINCMNVSHAIPDDNKYF